MGIRPWEAGLLTMDDFDRSCQAIDEYNRQLKRASEG